MAVTNEPTPRVLIVEDEPNIRELVRFHLSHERYSCETTGDGQAALKLAEAERFDLIVIDLMLARAGRRVALPRCVAAAAQHRHPRC